MNRQGRLKEADPGARSGSSHSAMASISVPQPIEQLHAACPPPFLTKTYDMVEDSSTNDVISWSSGNNSFIVWDPEAFSTSLLPRYFKHSNFSSFVRQLNTYGFKKVDPDRWEFANEGFLRGQRHLLKNIRRRRTSTQPLASQQSLDPCVELGRFGLDGEVARLKRDKQVLIVELVKLRQQQQHTKACIQTMEQRLRKTESKQQRMMSFLARAMRNPNFAQQLIQQKDKMKELEEAICNQRRRHIDQGPNHNVEVELEEFGVVGATETLVNIEPREYCDIYDFETPQADQLPICMQGLRGSQQKIEEERIESAEQHGNLAKEFDEALWENLLKDDIGEELVVLGGEEEDEEDIEVLVEQLG